ncbi:MAG TPA: DUF2177 family protein [Rhizobiales bacterium]|nr:DUF2177 family protein [Hyphomicrobiales bacterium]
MSKSYLTAYVATAVAFLAIDSVWLSVMASQFYRPLLGDLLAEDFDVAAAALFYVLYVGGIVFFAVRPAFADGRPATAAVSGAAFGLCAYGTYDLTNQATLRNWPTVVTVADLCWGTILTATAATIGYLVAARLGRSD